MEIYNIRITEQAESHFYANKNMHGSRGGGGGGRGVWASGPLENHMYVAIGFVRNSGTDPLEKQVDPLGRSNWAHWVQLFLEGGPYSPQLYTFDDK